MIRNRRCMDSGSVLSAIRNSVVPIRKDAMFSGPRETEKRILWPSRLDAGLRPAQRLSMNGSRPSVAGSGSRRSADLPHVRDDFLGEGKFIAGKPAARAEMPMVRYTCRTPTRTPAETRHQEMSRSPARYLPTTSRRR